MQTKKRAKPVKFGSTSKAAKVKEEIKKEAEKVISANKKEQEEAEKKASSVHPSGSEQASTSQDKPSETSPDQDVPKNKEEEGYFSADIETVDIIESVELQNDDSSTPQESDKKTRDENTDSPSEKAVEEEQVQVSDENPAVEESKESLVDKDGAFFSTPPDGYAKKKSMLPYFFMVMFATFILGLVFFGGIYYAISNKDKISSLVPKQMSEPTKAAPTEVPTPTPVDLAKYTVKVLNGTSVSGVAAKLKTQLTDAGFKVGTIGNADKDTYPKTEIVANKKVEKAYLDKLKEILKKSYTLGSSSVLASGDADVVITIGSASAK